jgi:hypothetical protein
LTIGFYPDKNTHMTTTISLDSSESRPARCKAFAGYRCIASGTLAEVARKTKEAMEHDTEDAILIFDEKTSRPIEIDFRGTADQVVKRLLKAETTAAANAAKVDVDDAEKRGPGRPKLGVVAREVTLLPRHWEWLNDQPGGASVALRKLVEEARRSSQGKDRVRKSQEAAYRFMSAMAGNLPGYEEALRVFYAKDYERFYELIKAWPRDVRDHVTGLAEMVIENEAVRAV